MALNVPTADFQTSSLNGAINASVDSMTIGTGLNIPATNGALQIDYDSTSAVGSASGPETILYATYNSGTGAVSGMTRGSGGTTAVTHANGASVQCGNSSVYFQALNALYDGWITALETWTRTANTTFTISGDFTSVYSVGDKLKVTDTTTKYFYITAVSYVGGTTTVTITGGTDYVLAASPTAQYYSKASSPVGFPGEFNLDASKKLSMNGKVATVRGWAYRSYESANYTSGGTTDFGVTFSSLPNLQVSAIGKSGGGTTLANVDTGIDCSLFVEHTSLSQIADLRLSAGGTLTTSITNGHNYFFNFTVTGTI